MRTAESALIKLLAWHFTRPYLNLQPLVPLIGSIWTEGLQFLCDFIELCLHISIFAFDHVLKPAILSVVSYAHVIQTVLEILWSLVQLRTKVLHHSSCQIMVVSHMHVCCIVGNKEGGK